MTDVETEDMTRIYDEAERYLHVALRRWYKNENLRDLVEDAHQEGMIQVWRDMEAGVTPKLKILRRASLASEQFMKRNGEYFFGRARKSRDGLTSNSKAQQKVQAYLDETMPLRGNVWPTATEVSNALGITRDSAGAALRKIKEGRIDHMKYRPDGRMDWDHYQTHSVETLKVSGDAGGNRHWSDNREFSRMFSQEFEDDIISKYNFIDLLEKIQFKYREVLYLRFVESWSSQEIGQYLATYKEGAEHQGANKRINRGLSQLRMALGVYEGACTKGHPRSAETCEIVRVDEYSDYYYRCKACKNKPPAQPKPPANKGTIGDPCPNGHKKDKITSNGYARCSTCLREAQARYRKKGA